MRLYDVEEYKNIKEMFEKTVEKHGEKVAFIIKEKIGKEEKYKEITFKEVYKDVKALGLALIKLGLLGKRIGIIAKNRYEWAIAYLATLTGVGIAVPLDKGLTETEIQTSVKRSKMDAIIFEKKYKENMDNLQKMNIGNIKEYICMDEIEGYKNIYDLIKLGKEELEKENNDFENLKIDEEKMSVIIFTSGTTSASKAVMLSQKNIIENINSLNGIVKIYPTDTALAFLPLHHTFGSTGLLFFMSNGVTHCFCDGLRYIAKNIQEYKVSVFVAVPLLIEAMYKKIMQEVEKQGKTNTVMIGRKISNFLLKLNIDIRRKLFKDIVNKLGGNLRLIVSGAASLEKETAKGLNEMGIRTIQGYGLTESSPVIAAENDKYIKYGSCGFAMPNVEIKIDNPSSEGIGEIIAKGPNIMLGYYEDEEATKAVLKEGWFHTGDLGYIDKDGYLFITGRKKNVIVLKNGKNIYPEEIETVINKKEYVLESLVFGMPKNDDLVLSAKIVYNKEYAINNLKDLSKEEIKAKIWDDIKEINKEMPIYKHIKKIIVTEEEMIKTTTAKIKRFEEIDKILKTESLQ